MTLTADQNPINQNPTDKAAIDKSATTKAVIDRVPLRDPAKVMRLSRLGSMHQSRLSFMRTLLRRLAAEKWTFTRPTFDINQHGVGHAIYCAHGPSASYSLIAFAHDLPDDQRSDRVIANAWDATFTLFDGIPSSDDILRLSANVPLQEAGRISERELSLSRANRSVRLWDHVVNRLSTGEQPDPALIASTGYLMRTTAVYGSGKFGAADRQAISDRPELRGPFQLEMLSVYLIRAFAKDLVEHMARIQAQKQGTIATKMDDKLAQPLGIGNSTGLGMAPFLINHPTLFNNWITARETAIARVRAVKTVSAKDRDTFLSILERSKASISQWHSEHPIQQKKLADLRRDLQALTDYLLNDQPQNLRHSLFWDRLVKWSETALSEEGQEFAISLALEPYPKLVDDLAAQMSDDESHAFTIDGALPVSNIRSVIERDFGWALKCDWEARENCARVWYVSQEKLEPRLGERFEEPISDYEQPLAPARDATLAHRALASYDDAQPIAQFLLQHPEHRHTVRRAQLALTAPYGEIRDNSISANLLPIDMLRAKLSMFGATRFDPRSDRWLRISMYGGAPYPEQLSPSSADGWVYPDLDV